MKEKKHIILPLVLIGLLVLMGIVFVVVLFIMASRATDNDGYGLGMYDRNGKIEADVAWYQEEQEDYYISTMSELAGLSQLVNEGNTFAGKTVYLTNDLVDAECIESIGTKMHPFS